MKQDADDATARLLRRHAEPDLPTSGACLDAETLAAWFDGTLTAARQRDAGSHASTCTRCQALLATMAQAEPPVVVPPRRGVSLVRWFAPALVAAMAFFLWIDVGRRSADVPQGSSAASPESAPAAVSTPQPPTDMPPLTLREPQAEPTHPSAPAAKPVQKRARAEDARGAVRQAQEPSRKTFETVASPAPPASPAPQGIAANSQALLKDDVNAPARKDALTSPSAQLIVRSPDGTQWRVDGDGTVSRSTDNGATWSGQRLGSSAHLLAGSSPSADVVWFGGTGGVVVTTADGVSWRWHALPEPVDVTGVIAADAQTATVTTRDGRRFVTHDGGVTWVRAPAQENSAAPFQ